MNWILTTLIMLLASSANLAQQGEPNRPAYPPYMPDAKTEVYKKVGDVQLKLYIFNPKDHQSSDSRAAIIFFFGGGWQQGSPIQFQRQCKHFASRGMVAIAADYRVGSRHGVNIPSCISDGKSAVRWVRSKSGRLGIDPDRIAAGGGSAGGHIAVSTGLLPDFDEPDEDRTISSIPNALVLFNPAVVLAPVEGKKQVGDGKEHAERRGDDPVAVSPLHHIKPEAPPTLILHGKADELVPYWTVELFSERMTEQGNVCTLVGFEDKGHGFFNYRDGANSAYTETIEAAEQFLVELGYLP